MGAARSKVCLVIENTDEGGDARHLLDLARYLDRDRFRLHVVSLSTPRGLVLQIQRLDVPVHSLDLPDATGWRRSWWSFAGMLTLANLLRRLRPEMVHTFGARADPLGRMAARFAGVPRVIGTSRRNDRLPGLAGLVSRATSYMTDVTVAPTASHGRHLTDRFGIHPTRVLTILPGIDLARVSGEVPPPDLVSDGPLIGTVGHLDEDRGVDRLLEAAVILARYHPKLRVVVAGTGPDGIRTVRLAQRLGISDRVSIPGNREDVGAILAALDVFVLPARRGGLPLALLEALGAGVPVVASPLPGIHEALEHDVHALLVDTSNPAFIADAVDRILTDAPLAGRLARAGKELVANRFLAGRMAAEHQELYELMLTT